MNIKTKTIVKFICLLVALSLVTFLVILGSNKEAKRESIKAQEVEKVKKEALPKPPITQKAVQEELLPQKEPFEELEEAETDIIETVQGRVTGIELICTDMIVMVDGIHLDAGSVDVTGIQIGDVVEVTYLKMKYAKFVQSIEVLEPVEDKLLPPKEPLQEPEESPEWQVVTEKAPLEEPAKAVEKGGCLLKKNH
ncbi:MAG: hypothetical protein JRF30_07295 [Deltaproteobacteria bacterium]|nr:hypothetical protein [Deltaproteobacteria bacterium]MBW1794537.1 hypothetical protein [Deltaproteobacteria bacterium]MBW2330719.1 hypothetical protein [Deltaproteobacteria bacterium]